MPERPSNIDFNNLWPTTFLQRRINGHEAANHALKDFILELELKNRNLTTDYLSENFFTLGHSATDWLKECVNKTTIDYLHHQGMDYSINWSVQGWANVNRLGDYHNVHNHPHSYLSGTYYVSIPDSPREAGSRGDLNSGAISFYDPRPQANMNAIRDDGQIEAEHIVFPEAGMILMWPSFLHHFVHPNLTSEERISVSFNVVLKWSDQYLPKQA